MTLPVMASHYRFRPASGQRMLAHVTSRIVNRAFWFDEEGKRVFRGLMRKFEAFGGLRVITYCLMSNHFHILVEVPERPGQMLDEEAMLGHLEQAFGKRKARQYRELFARSHIRPSLPRGIQKIRPSPHPAPSPPPHASPDGRPRGSCCK